MSKAAASFVLVVSRSLRGRLRCFSGTYMLPENKIPIMVDI